MSKGKRATVQDEGLKDQGSGCKKSFLNQPSLPRQTGIDKVED
jgi:hypothetical protein